MRVPEWVIYLALVSCALAFVVSGYAAVYYTVSAIENTSSDGVSRRCQTDTYPATVVRIIDGDTMVMDVHLGFDVTRRVTVRLKNIDTPEVRGPNRDPVRGPAATEFVDSWVSEHGSSFRLIDHGLGKYGRVIGEVCADECLSGALKKAGMEK